MSTRSIMFFLFCPLLAGGCMFVDRDVKPSPGISIQVVNCSSTELENISFAPSNFPQTCNLPRLPVNAVQDLQLPGNEKSQWNISRFDGDRRLGGVLQNLPSRCPVVIFLPDDCLIAAVDAMGKLKIRQSVRLEPEPL